MSSTPTQMDSEESSTFDTSLNGELLKAMQSNPRHSQLERELLTAETEMKSFERKQEEKKDSPPLSAQPPAPARKTFIQQAEDDHKRLKDFVDDHRYYKESRGAVVALIKRTLDEAKVQGYDDKLYETYVHIQSFVRHWHYEEPFLSTVTNTLSAIRQNRLARQLSDNGRLSTENTRLREMNARLQQSEQLTRKVYEIQKKVAEDKSAMIQQKDKVMVTFIDKYSQLEAKVSELNKQCEKAADNLNKACNRIEELLKENETLRASKGKPTKKRPSSPPPSGYDPRLLGSSRAQSEDKASSRPSSKPGGSRSTR